MDQFFVSVFVPSIDEMFSLEISINLEMKEVLDMIQKTICELSDQSYQVNPGAKLYDKNTGLLINPNNIVKFSGLKNGACLMLI